MSYSEQAVFAALADETRRDLLAILARSDRPVHSLAERFAISRPAVSRHLKLLQRAGLVRRQTRGRENVYRLNPAPLRAVRDWSDALTGYWQERLDALQQLAEEDHS